MAGMMRNLFLFIVLVLISAFSVALVAARIWYSGQITFIFLVWNLFLAWLPLTFAWLALRWQKRPFIALPMFFLWLLFLPNAPYLVTDLIHLQARAPVPLWYDLILLLNYALIGILLGFVSLRIMQGIVNGRFGPAAGWLFAFFALSASGLGIYIGRFLRWNSWDIFLRPMPLLQDIWVQLFQPRTLAISGMLALIMILAYIVFSLTPAQSSNSEYQSL